MSDYHLKYERLLEVLDYNKNTGHFTWKETRGGVKRGSIAGAFDSRETITINIDRKKYRAHRLAWLWMTGEWPSAEIDHKNGIKTDNRWGNLRDVRPSVNQQNRRSAQKNNKCGLLGVSLERKKWRATITINRKQKRIGAFATPEEAHAAYLVAKRGLHEGCTI